jgi:CheY-like chemotaxis protein
MDGKKKVLLIDDDHAVLAFLTAKLAKRYDVVSTVDARKSIALARSQLPDVILCDIDMPDMSGGDVAAALESDSMTARIPLIYLTALVTPEETQELGGLVGGRPGISKRATVGELVARIEQVLEG